ncbi:hypothetical protein LAZ67_19001880 [Cordylochernes scorpioides]|uniref:Peptidase aspartic putative domain-containing protein n=1 Tax=Cordylochernes scorpioides TaxID=51811 RepID=A0ABY6LKX4_9ARAC|nr:hypothetical protein LAZ67_19001880 [Cordylochernes scorpioides]
MYDQLESHLKSLESLGVNIQQNAYFLHPMVESSLPEDLMTSLLEFMRREFKREQRLGYIRDGLGESSRMRTNGHYVTNMHAAEVKSNTEKANPHCIICQGGHWIQRCQKWCAMPVNPKNRRQPRTKPQNSPEKKMENTRLEDKMVPVNEQVVAYQGCMYARQFRKPYWLQHCQDLCLSIPASWHSLPLADPQFERSRKIDMILGADVYGQLLIPDIKRQRQNQLCAQNTILGWVISGKLPLDILKRFWQVEEIPIKRRSSAEEEFCEQLYQSEVKRTRTGRYVVPLPLDPTIFESDLFGLSVAICFRRQLAMERRLDRDVAARDVEGCCYLPDHAVRGTQPDKKKLRVVFDDATKTTNGFSLNDRLYAGPKLQNDISSVLLRWRLPKIVMVVDIEKMYRQILVRPQDALRQRILWRQNARETMRPYQLNTVTYGTSSAPFLALRTLIKLAKDVGHLYPKAAEAIQAMGLQRELIDLLRRRGFVLKKWASNDPALLDQISEEYRLEQIVFEKTEIVKTLGLGWDPREDSFVYAISDPNKTEEFTKRQMLYFIAKQYDPMGWLVPLLIVGNILIQRLWITGTTWDEPLDDSIKIIWQSVADSSSHPNNAILGTNIESITYWTDATIVLQWIETLSRALPTFVGNRVSEIQACRKIKQWRHVPSKDNPADIASRVTMGTGLRDSQLWWKGPTWLAVSPKLWPEMPNIQAHCDETEALISSESDQPSMLIVLGERCS